MNRSIAFIIVYMDVHSHLHVGARENSRCECGHASGTHYQFNFAMPCSCCGCEMDTSQYGIEKRKHREESGVADHEPSESWTIARGYRLRGEPVPWLLVRTTMQYKRDRLKKRRRAWARAGAAKPA